MYSFRRDSQTWWDQDQSVENKTAKRFGRLEPSCPSSERNGGCATVQIRQSLSEHRSKGKPVGGATSSTLSAAYAPCMLRYHPSERGRMKEIRGYQASTLLRNYKLPLIFRHPVCDRDTPTRDGGMNLPPITSSASGLTTRRPQAWRDQLDRCSKVVSIPPVERRMIVPCRKARPSLEAKGTKAQAHSRLEEEVVTKRKSRPYVSR